MWMSLERHDFGPGNSAAQAILKGLAADRNPSSPAAKLLLLGVRDQ